MAGLCTGYFAFRMTKGSPAFNMQESKVIQWTASASLPDSSGQQFYGSGQELSHLYYALKSDFQEVVDGGIHALKEASSQRDLLFALRDTASSDPEQFHKQLESVEYKMELLRLLDYYTHYFMHYYRWIDTGEMSSSVSYKLSMGQFRATVAYHQEKYRANPNPPGMNLEELLSGTRVTGQTNRAVRWARVLTVFLLFTLVMGIPRFIRDRGYRRFAATLYFDALFRPHKISDLNAWHSINRMAVALIILYLFGGVVLSSFSSWLFPVILGILGILPLLFLTAVMGQPRKSREIVVSLMAPKVLIMLTVLLVVAVRGPMFFWYHFWVSPIFRALFLAVFVMLIFHKFHVNSVLARKWSHRNRRGAAAMVGMAFGIQLLFAGVLLQVFGLEESLEALNRELLLLPGGGPEQPGVADWLGWNLNLPIGIIALGGIVLAINTLIFLFNKNRMLPSSKRG